ncbi:MAG TPA: KUP/HAK/KT family potassium transporter [Bdellovibrionota bacterium]|nr:KUP/HAK/KT family potassium transporter [Bdellovibrionota bacterium]
MAEAEDRRERLHKAPTFKLALGALGVVFGDIGTSPLYAIRESFNPAHGLPLTEANILGVLSLVFWSLTIVVSVKYLGFILRADHEGEGGITTLLALLLPRLQGPERARERAAVVLLALLGAGLLYGDGVLTPAISVLSAVEGLGVAAPGFRPAVVPVTVVILVALFALQSRGTGHIGALFGPLTAVWFFMIALMGLPWIFHRPDILRALNPYYAVSFFARNGHAGFLCLGAVVLCITGAEALYADMGHFGRKPIRLDWFVLVFPCLLLSYFGQGALVLDRGEAVLDNTFYGQVGGWLLYPVVAVATGAAVVASQALISGVFSLTQQAVQLGYLPRVTIHHTSRHLEGQIFVPRVNVLLMVACIALVLEFQESAGLAGAYGLAVTATMVVTSLLFGLVTVRIWGWNPIWTMLMLLAFLSVDLGFFLANVVKIGEGGWFPVLVGMIMLALMTSWKRGREMLGKRMEELAVPLDEFFEQLAKEKPPRVKGTAVFLTLTRDIAPSVLLHHYRHNQSLHRQVLLLSIVTEHRPEVAFRDRLRITDLPQGFVKLVARYGYMQTPDVREILILAERAGLKLDPEHISYFLGRETYLNTGDSGMAKWRRSLFVFLSRNARPATEFFGLPPDRVIELGAQIRI